MAKRVQGKPTRRIQPKRKVLVDPRLDGELVTADPIVGKYGDVVKLYHADGKTPVCGGSYYIFLDQNKSNITLFHPFSMTKFVLDLPAFVVGRQQNDWDPGPAKLAEMLQRKIQQWQELKREVQNFIPLLVKHYQKMEAAC
jgi:hypothetical protein